MEITTEKLSKIKAAVRNYNTKVNNEGNPFDHTWTVKIWKDERVYVTREGRRKNKTECYIDMQTSEFCQDKKMDWQLKEVLEKAIA